MEQRVGPAYLEAQLRRGDAGRLLDCAIHTRGQIVRSGRGGTQVPDGAARLRETALDQIARRIELRAGCVQGGAEQTGDQLKLHADADDVLRESVVDLARD